MTIWKYPLKLGTYAVNMPEGAEILDVQVQEETICLWAWVDPDRPLKWRHFLIAGTGHRLPTERYRLRYIGTVQQPPFVWHILENLSE